MPECKHVSELYLFRLHSEPLSFFNQKYEAFMSFSEAQDLFNLMTDAKLIFHSSVVEILIVNIQ
jgi:hypothetical protein